MAREEEMWKSIEEEHGTLTSREALVSLTAMEWADKTMLEKACEWLEENYYNVYQGTWQEIKEQFINDFKKAMEE